MRFHYFWVSVLSVCAAAQELHGQDLNFLPAPSAGIFCQHLGFSVSYSEKHNLSEWVAYRLIDSMVVGGAERTNRFIPDPNLPVASANPKLYAKSGYDKGHLCPAADMKYSSAAMKETFYTSNIAPQLPRFNRIAWKHLEELVRSWAKKYGVLFIVTGPVLRDSLPFIGAVQQVSIPEYFYKVILDTAAAHQQAIGFVMPNRDCASDLSVYAVSVDSVELLTRLNFFAGLPDSVQTVVESRCDTKAWGLKEKEILHKMKTY